MDQKTYKLITDLWTFLRIRIQEINENDNSEEWWDKEHKDIVKLLEIGDGEPEYFKKFVFTMCDAADQLLFDIHFARKEEANEGQC